MRAVTRRIDPLFSGLLETLFIERMEQNEDSPGAVARNARKHAPKPLPQATLPVPLAEMVEVRDLAVYELMLEAA